MPIRLLHIIPSLERGGAEKQLALLAAGLPRDEFDVQVCCLTRGGAYEEDLRKNDVPCHIVGKRLKYDPLAYRRLKKHIRDVRPDIVHTWLFACNAYGRKAALAAGVKHIVAGERCVDRWKRWHHWAVDRWLARRTNVIVANSTGVRDYGVSHGLPADKFTIIPNGIAPPAASQPDEVAAEREALLQQLNLPSSVHLIGAVGRLWPQKNYKHMLWSMCLLKEIRRDFHLLIFGDGPHRWRLERYGRQVQILGDHVSLLGERGDVARFLPALTCLVNTSDYEGKSNAIMEAMAAGLPVVATDIPGNRDLVLPKETGFLTPLGDRAETARCVNELLDDAELRLHMGEAGRARMMAEFSLERMIQRHVELYCRLMN